MPILLNERGIPQPSPELQRRLREVHPGLTLRLVDGSRWSVGMAWSPDDRRWEYVQRQEMPADGAYDNVGYLPLDCSPDEAPGYLAARMRRHQREDVRRMADALWQSSVEAPQAAMEQALAEVLDNPNPAGTPVAKRRGRPPKVAA